MVRAEEAEGSYCCCHLIAYASVLIVNRQLEGFDLSVVIDTEFKFISRS